MITKVCGLREPQNMTDLSKLPIQWMGMIFYPPSPRFVGEQDNLLPFLDAKPTDLANIKRVGVFVNATFEELLQTTRDYALDLVQLHGGESPVYCEALTKYLKDEGLEHVQIIRAFRVSRAFDFGITIDYEPFCGYFIFDTKGQAYGGTGHKFDWTILDRYQGKVPFLLSGGIGPDDAQAVKAVQHPQLAGYDLNSRFEERPGYKNPTSLQTFLEQVSN